MFWIWSPLQIFTSHFVFSSYIKSTDISAEEFDSIEMYVPMMWKPINVQGVIHLVREQNFPKN